MKYANIEEYHRAQETGDQAICERLRELIDSVLPHAESKIWHGSPVWFSDNNPLVGYHKLKDGVRLLFWSGQSFDEEALIPEGKFKAAEYRFHHVNDIDEESVRRWISKSESIQWDYANIVKRKGELIRLR